LRGGGRGLASASGLMTRLIGGGLSLFDLIVDKAAGEPCSRADAGAKPGIPGDGANDRAASSVPPAVVAYPKIGRGLTWRLHCDSVVASSAGSSI
jgi:hypothetical protein